MRRPIYILVAILLWVPGTLAQSTDRAVIAGSVVDADSGQPLANVNVFLAGTTQGTATNRRGLFRIDDIPSGHYRLYASRVGYEPAARDTLLNAGRTITVALKLKPTVLNLSEVRVSSERDRRWERRLRRFQKLFLGESERADSARIVNPGVLDFETRWWGKLTAQARQTLVIENRFLGYRLRYFLKEFSASGGTIRWDGEPLFEPLTPSDSAEAAAWQENRRRAYYGSLRHFLRALLANRTEEEGFVVHHLPPQSETDNVKMRVNPHRFLSEEPGDTHPTLHFYGRLEITYLEEPESDRYLKWRGRTRRSRSQQSFIELNDGPVTVDRSGEIVEPYGATVYGYFAFERIADRVPKGYDPEAGSTSRPAGER